jgi:uncharacterized protein (DUF2236 family)
MRWRYDPRVDRRAAGSSACPVGAWVARFHAGAGVDRRADDNSVAWKLQREIVLLVAWGPAVLLQLAHPLVACGVADHSSFLRERWGRTRRLSRTLDAMLRLSFGTEAEAEAVVAGINAIHDRVHGQLPEAIGIFPAGTPYSARDPALLAWVHATLVDMNIGVYELYVGDLSFDERDRYCAEASWLGPHLGVPEDRLPRSFGALRRYMDGMLASGELAVTDTARTLAHSIVYPPVPRLARPVTGLLRLSTVGLLPSSLRGAYGFPWGPRDEARLRRSAAIVRRLLPLAPPVVRCWPAARARRRAADSAEPSPRGHTSPDRGAEPFG